MGQAPGSVRVDQVAFFRTSDVDLSEAHQAKRLKQDLDKAGGAVADQGKWFKLWCSALHDDDLENLSLEDWSRWARLGAHIKAHGKDGKIRFREPGTSLVNLFRVPDFNTAIMIIKRLPNFAVGERESTVTTETNTTVTYEIESLNWLKYQGDFSNDRVRKFRDKKRHAVTVQEERRREEKRGEEINTPIVPKGTGPKVLEWFEKTWQAYPKERRVGKKASLRSYQKDVRTLEEAKQVARALDVYLKTETVKNGYVRNASTFFSNWRDYADTRIGQGISSQAAEGQSDHASPGSREQVAATHVVLGKLADSKTFGA